MTDTASTMMWYAVKTHIEAESRVKTVIAEKVKKVGLEHKIGRILVPTEKVSEIRKGKKYVIGTLIVKHNTIFSPIYVGHYFF